MVKGFLVDGETETLQNRSIRHCIAMLAPYCANESGSVKGQRDFYNLMFSLYQEMLKAPELFLVNSRQYDTYISTAKPKEAKQKKEKEHETDAKESTLRNVVQQSIQFYAHFLYQLAALCEGVDTDNGALVITLKHYQEVLDWMNRFHDAEHHSERYQAFIRFGLHVEEKNTGKASGVAEKNMEKTSLMTEKNTGKASFVAEKNIGKVSFVEETKEKFILIYHEKYRYAMEGLLFLCKVPENPYKWMNYLRLDFKNAEKGAPSIEDICETLPEKNAELVSLLIEYLKKMKVKTKLKPLRGIVSDFTWKVEFIQKGVNICCFYADDEYFMLCIHFNHFQNITNLATKLYAENQPLFQWFQSKFPERLCKCPSNRRVSFAGEERRICGMSNRAEIENPTEEDIKNAFTVLKLYRG